nr:hypothetical protein [Tanacetum cinerariifolium]
MKFIPAKDDILPAEEQSLPTIASPTTKSPGYIDESDPDEVPKEDPADYLANGGNEGDDEDESFDDDEDDDVDIEGDKEEGEHLAPADSTAVALPTVDHAPSTEETEPFKTKSLSPHHHHILQTAWMVIVVDVKWMVPWLSAGSSQLDSLTYK